MQINKFSLSQKNKSNFLLIGIFLTFASLMGIFSVSTGAYTLFFTIIVSIFSFFWVYMGVYYLVSIQHTFLQISNSKIEFKYPLGSKCIMWNELPNIHILGTKMFFVSSKKTRTTFPDILTRIFYKKNEIPLNLFVNDWLSEESWNNEPLLILLSEPFLIEDPNVTTELKK